MVLTLYFLNPGSDLLLFQKADDPLLLRLLYFILVIHLC